MSLKNLLSHCFSNFFSFYELELCSYIGKFWYIYIIGIIYSNLPAYYISLIFPTPLFIKTPLIYLRPKSSSFKLKLKILRRKTNRKYLAFFSNTLRRLLLKKSNNLGVQKSSVQACKSAFLKTKGHTFCPCFHSLISFYITVWLVRAYYFFCKFCFSSFSNTFSIFCCLLPVTPSTIIFLIFAVAYDNVLNYMKISKISSTTKNILSVIIMIEDKTQLFTFQIRFPK